MSLNGPHLVPIGNIKFFYERDIPYVWKVGIKCVRAQEAEMHVHGGVNFL